MQLCMPSPSDVDRGVLRRVCVWVPTIVTNGRQQVRPCALRDHNNTIPLPLEDGLGEGQHAMRSLHGEGHLGNEAHIHLSRGERGVRRDVPCVPPHELHDAQAVRGAGRLDHGRLDRLPGLRDCRVETEGTVDHTDVVVDRLWHARHGHFHLWRNKQTDAKGGVQRENRVSNEGEKQNTSVWHVWSLHAARIAHFYKWRCSAPQPRLTSLSGLVLDDISGAVRSVPSDDVQLVNAAVHACLHDGVDVEAAARRAQNRPAHAVDAANALRGQVDPREKARVPAAQCIASMA